jgi:hypothetical protein
VRPGYDDVLGHPGSAAPELDASVLLELESLELESLVLESLELVESHEGCGVGVPGLGSESPGAPAGP